MQASRVEWDGHGHVFFTTRQVDYDRMQNIAAGLMGLPKSERPRMWARGDGVARNERFVKIALH